VRDRKAGKQRLYALERTRAATRSRVGRRVSSAFWNESFDWLDAYVQDLQAGTAGGVADEARRGPGAPAQSATADREIVISRVISAPRELVFEAFHRGAAPLAVVGTGGVHHHHAGRSSSALAGVWDFVMHGPDGDGTTRSGSPGPISRRRKRIAMPPR